LNTEDVLTGAVDRPYGQLQYAVSGRNHGQAVLLLHPLGSDLAFWQPQLKTLGLRFRVIRFDARGHGGSVIAAGAPLCAQRAQDPPETGARTPAQVLQAVFGAIQEGQAGVLSAPTRT
jgi:pimeloyl-ACP methyl ester carboxylesterase